MPVEILDIKGQVEWSVAEDPDTGHWYGICKDLNLSTDGSSHEELRDHIVEVVQMFFEELHSTGDLEQFLTERGWVMKKISPSETHSFQVPVFSEQRGSYHQLMPA